MPIDSTAVHRHLARLSQQRSLDAALAFFDALGYQYADELPLPTRTWPDGIRQLLQASADPPLYLAARCWWSDLCCESITHSQQEARGAARLQPTVVCREPCNL